MVEEGSFVNVEELRKSIVGDLVKAGLIDAQGLRVSGNGVIITLLSDLKILIDKTNLKLYGLGKEIEKLRMEARLQ